MIPKLYAPGDFDFSKNGIGLLTDCISCTVEEELNGQYELYLEYPVNGIHSSLIRTNCYVSAKANPFDQVQHFRVYSVKKTMLDTLIIRAEHISYYLNSVPIFGGTATNTTAAAEWWNGNQAFTSGFRLIENGGIPGNDNLLFFIEPVPARFLLKQFAEFFNCELKFDEYDVYLQERRGADRGVTMRYGVNLTALTSIETFSGKYNGIYPYYSKFDEESGQRHYVELDSKIYMWDVGENDIKRVLPVDLTDMFSSRPAQIDLLSAAEYYINTDKEGTFSLTPDLNIDISYVDFRKSMEYNGIVDQFDVGVGDTITIIYGDFDLNVNARVLKIRYDSLNERNIGLTVGTARKNVADTILKQQKEINDLKKRS